MWIGSRTELHNIVGLNLKGIIRDENGVVKYDILETYKESEFEKKRKLE